MATRVVHRVRCRKKDNKQVWADVKVVDAFLFKAANGETRVLFTKAKEASPWIKDDTGGRNGKGSAESATRGSHMELVKAEDDPSQKFYIEVLDTITFAPPPKHQIDQAGAQQKSDPNQTPDGARFGKGPYIKTISERDATKYIVDKVGLGLAQGGANGSTRSMHVNLVTEKGNTDDKTDGLAAANDTVPPKHLAWCATVKADCINIANTGRDYLLYFPQGDQQETDWTVMTTDPDTHEPCPPDNTDPNIYVAFPGDKDGDPNGVSTGCSVKIPIRRDGTKPIDQGPLWWIERISPTFQPWFWYAAINTPKAFSFFGSPGRLGNWAWRGFILWNNYPVIWILSSNLPIQPMGQFGSPSLELCARIGSWDFGFPPVPSSYFQVPGRGDPNSASAAPTQLELLAGIVAGGIVGGANEDSPDGVGRTEAGPFGPFGILQMTHPPIGPLPDAVPYGAVGDGDQIFQGKPNIWQLTGKPQPKRVDPTKQWEPFSNPYLPPSKKEAEDAARLFETNWNAVANGHNDFIEGFVPGGGVSNGAQGYDQPPDWHWAILWYDGSNGPPTDYRASFQNGIPPGVATKFFPLEIYAPATAWTLHVDQLRPDWWDTTRLEFYTNPLNAFFPIVLPPFLWSNDPWTGTNNPPHNNPPTGP